MFDLVQPQASLDDLTTKLDIGTVSLNWNMVVVNPSGYVESRAKLSSILQQFYLCYHVKCVFSTQVSHQAFTSSSSLFVHTLDWKVYWGFFSFCYSRWLHFASMLMFNPCGCHNFTRWRLKILHFVTTVALS
jgi:hypothetical protein